MGAVRVATTTQMSGNTAVLNSARPITSEAAYPYTPAGELGFCGVDGSAASAGARVVVI